MAAYMPAQLAVWGSVLRTGVPPGSPASQRLPLAAVISRSPAGVFASGAPQPKGVIVVYTRAGFDVLSVG